MSLRIRCPHCRRVLVVEYHTAGRRTRCTACDGLIDVPMPAGKARERVEVASRCPRCKQDVAPGTAHCPHCHTELASGKRLPLGRRIRLVPLRLWALWFFALVWIGLLAFVGVNIYCNRLQRLERSAPPAGSASRPTVSASAPPMPARCEPGERAWRAVASWAKLVRPAEPIARRGARPPRP